MDFSPPARWRLLDFMLVARPPSFFLLPSSSFFLAGPHLPALDRSEPPQISSASSRSQWASRDLHCQLSSAVGLAGPQPARVWALWASPDLNQARFGALWASPDLNRRDSARRGPQPDLNRQKQSSYRMPKRMPKRMPYRMPKRMPDRMSEDTPDRMSEVMPDRMSEDMPDRMSEEYDQTECQIDMPDRMSEDMPDGMPT